MLIVKYNKSLGVINLKGKVSAIDKKNNIIKTGHAEYNENENF